jgi:hypothetical protein
MNTRSLDWVAHAFRVLVLVSRQDNLSLKLVRRSSLESARKVRHREDAIASTRERVRYPKMI